VEYSRVVSAPRKTGTGRPPARPVVSRLDASSPDIKVSYSPVGRETLEAISDEILEEQPTTIYKRRRPLGSAPEIVIGESPVGRETLAAIQAELTSSSSKPREAPASGPLTSPQPPSRSKPRRGKSSRPPAQKLAASAPVTTPALAQVEVFELLTFVVRNAEPADLSTLDQRLGFVERHLIHRLPSHSLGAVRRVDVTPWTERGMLVIRVWCGLDPTP
jgi:hypothetical protein